jgi:hypothetical protein
MSEALGHSFESPRRRDDVKEDILDASKEGLAAILNEFKLDPLLVQKAAHNLIEVIDAHKKPLNKARYDDMGSLRTLAIDTVAEILAERQMNTPEVLTVFEDTMNDYLPG